MRNQASAREDAAQGLAEDMETSDDSKLIATYAKPLTQELARTRTQDLLLEQSVAEHCQHYKTPALTFSKSLQAVGDWYCCPAPLPTSSLVFDATTLTAAPPDEPNLAALSRAWKGRHAGISRPPSQKIPARKESMCFQECFCHCSKTRAGMEAGCMWQKARATLRKLFKKKEDTQHLVDGHIILVWIGRRSKEEEPLCILTHVGLQYLRPFRPTLVTLHPETSEDQARLLNAATNLSQSRPLSSVATLCLCKAHWSSLQL